MTEANGKELIEGVIVLPLLSIPTVTAKRFTYSCVVSVTR